MQAAAPLPVPLVLGEGISRAAWGTRGLKPLLERALEEQIGLSGGQTGLRSEACAAPALALWQRRRRSASGASAKSPPSGQEDRRELLNFATVMAKAARVQRPESSEHLSSHIRFVRPGIAASL